MDLLLKHKNEVFELNRLEQHLIELIADINNDLLRDKFLEYQQQRNVCNSIHNEWLSELLNNMASK